MMHPGVLASGTRSSNWHNAKVNMESGERIMQDFTSRRRAVTGFLPAVLWRGHLSFQAEPTYHHIPPHPLDARTATPSSALWTPYDSLTYVESNELVLQVGGKRDLIVESVMRMREVIVPRIDAQGLVD